MRIGGRLGKILLVVATLVGGGVAVVGATTFPVHLDRPAEVGATAVRLTDPARPGDAVSVYEVGELSPALASAVAAAATTSSASWAPVRSGTVGAVAVRRGGTDLRRPAPGSRLPFVLTAMPVPAARAVLGPAVADAIGATGRLAMGESTARRWQARAGDVVDVVAGDGSIRSLVIGAVVPDAEVGGAEAILSVPSADAIGMRRVSRAVIWGFESRTSIVRALRSSGIEGRHETRAVRSWQPRDPDSTLGTARTKELLGEFEFRVNADGSITQEAAWQAANLPPDRQVLDPVIRIRARCHLGVVDDLRAALAEVAAAGLAWTIQVANANAYGGCHYPRYNRISAEFGFLSRHSWGMALDTNTVENCQGCVPKMDCRVVRIFRKHGFAWGGNFLRPDGMHFEWVGERRDQLPYPSRYCPNTATLSTADVDGPTLLDAVADSRDRLFADETLSTEHDGHGHDGHDH